jgi:hypothetical protein
MMGNWLALALIESEQSSTAEVRGWIGERCVRVLEVADEWALVQPWDQPRQWALVRADLVRASLAGQGEGRVGGRVGGGATPNSSIESAISGEPEVKA